MDERMLDILRERYREELAESAAEVFAVSGSGQIVVTDPVTESTHLCGFFIPSFHMNRLGRAVGKVVMSDDRYYDPAPPLTTYLSPKEIAEEQDEKWGTDWIAAQINDPCFGCACECHEKTEWWFTCIVGGVLLGVLALGYGLGWYFS